MEMFSVLFVLGEMLFGALIVVSCSGGIISRYNKVN
jgi:hypothetical protein